MADRVFGNDIPESSPLFLCGGERGAKEPDGRPGMGLPLRRGFGNCGEAAGVIK